MMEKVDIFEYIPIEKQHPTEAPWLCTVEKRLL